MLVLVAVMGVVYVGALAVFAPEEIARHEREYAIIGL
jgi:hypothetical protein